MWTKILTADDFFICIFDAFLDISISAIIFCVSYDLNESLIKPYTVTFVMWQNK